MAYSINVCEFACSLFIVAHSIYVMNAETVDLKRTDYSIKNTDSISNLFVSHGDYDLTDTM